MSQLPECSSLPHSLVNTILGPQDLPKSFDQPLDDVWYIYSASQTWGASNPPESLWEQIAGPNPQNSDPVDLVAVESLHFE